MKTEDEKMKEYLAQPEPFYDPAHPVSNESSPPSQLEQGCSVIGIDEYGNPIIDPDSDFDEDGHPKRVFDEDGNELFSSEYVEET